MRFTSFAIKLCLVIAGSTMVFACTDKKKEESAGQPPPSVAEVSEPEAVPPEKILNPLDSIKELDKKIEAYKTGSNLTPEETEANHRLKQEIIRGTFNIYELCRLALDVHWQTMTPAERKNFVDLMTNLLEKKAVFSKEQVKGDEKPYRISYGQEKFLDPEKKRAMVVTRLDIPSEKIDLDINYELELAPSGWRIYDVIVDDASLVENYKFQFDTIISKHSLAELESRMRKKLEEME